MTELDRRDWLKVTLGASVATALPVSLANAASSSPTSGGPTSSSPPPGAQALATGTIPSSGQKIPVIGLGSSATFSQAARDEDVKALGEVMAALIQNGGTVFDTAPSYGASEAVAGQIARDSGLADRLFWATKVNVASRNGGKAAVADARAQLQTSFDRIGRKTVDLIQVHNMGDVATQLPLLRELKDTGRIRYLGVTTTFKPQYAELIETMRRERLDFIGIDYAIDNRDVEETILPLARERGIAVMAYAPFGRTRLFKRVGDRPLPDWAAEIDAKTWGQVFLKFVISHPAVVVTTPATSRVSNLVDNVGAGLGRMPDEAMRQRMAAFIDSLPAAS